MEHNYNQQQRRCSEVGFGKVARNGTPENRFITC